MEKRSWSEIQKEKLSNEINRQMIWGKNLMAVRVEIAPNAIIPTHEHESEQLTTVQHGQITLHFSDAPDVTLGQGEMLLIPSMAQHSVSSGPEGADVIDFFAPIRQDFIDGSTSYFNDSGKAQEKRDPYLALRGYLAAVGIEVNLEKLREYPVDLIARYAYEKECVTMGQLRDVLGLDKKAAKEMLRQWKQGDDHSESSYRRSLERIVIVPNVFYQTGGCAGNSCENAKEKDGREKDTES
ncbi:MAG: cupin domain-containing protein [Desulfomonilaceae bacterium]